MSIKNKIPKIGARTVKTALAVMASMLIFAGTGYIGSLLARTDWAFWSGLGVFLTKQDAIFGCVGAVVCMQQTVKNSLRSGADRLLGTAVGGAVGLFLFWVNMNIWEGKLLILWVTFGTILSIWLVLLMKRPDACAVCAITLLIILVSVDRNAPFLYAVNRMLDTAIGIAVSLAVNRLVRPIRLRAAAMAGEGDEKAGVAKE